MTVRTESTSVAGVAESAKHGAAAGLVPVRADWTIDQGWDRYTAPEHAVWKTLFERQSQLLPGRACDAFLEGMRQLPIDAEQIPDFRRLSEVLMRHTGWQIVAVPGLVPDKVFFEHLANRRSPGSEASAHDRTHHGTHRVPPDNPAHAAYG